MPVMFRRSGGAQRRAMVNKKVVTQLVWLDKTRAWREEAARYERFKELIRKVRRAGGGPRDALLLRYLQQTISELHDKVQVCKLYASLTCRQANNYRMYLSLYQAWTRVTEDPNAFLVYVELYTSNGKVL